MTYSAIVTRDGKWWMISIPELNGLTQARRLAEAELMAKEYVAVTLDLPIESISVALTVERVGAIEDIAKTLERIHSEREQASWLERDATAKAAELARGLAQQGVPLRDVGTLLGVSHQRAHQLVNA
ncbi:hypothetical protein [Rathayibacter soli]|uniref:hypothetical protein n=1 Tax=Rathayibacter soli TaxID=3144168 RepID=UPI0027E4B72E|nr:hypothetical protein [Glaciibacter superstes]